MSASPAFASTPRSAVVNISTAETSRTAPTGAGTLLTGAAGGSVVAGLRVKATAATTAGLIFVFLHDGSNYRLISEILVSAITPSGTVAAFEKTWVPDQAIILADANWSIRVSTYNAESFNVEALLAGDL